MLRACFRALLLILLLLAGLVLATALLADRRGRFSREKLAQWWHRRLLRVLGVRLRVSGAPMTAPQLIVANHVSWLDIPVLAALAPTRFVSKSEVRHWPVAGQLADACGTFYLRRGRDRLAAAAPLTPPSAPPMALPSPPARERDAGRRRSADRFAGASKPLLEALISHLRSGGSVTLFPEGTTTDGITVRPFHARLFAAAVESGCRVQPVALCYRSAAAPFVGDDTLVGHILGVLGQAEIVVDVVFCPPLSPADADRNELGHAADYGIRRVVEALALEQREAEEVAAELMPV